jgi:hypothetical protein
LRHLIAYAVPVLPGQSDRVRDFGRELSAVRDRYDELNRAATVSRHVVFLQSSPAGDVAIHIMEANDPSRFLRDFDDSAYDRCGWTTCGTSTASTFALSSRRHRPSLCSIRLASAAGTTATWVLRGN